MVRGCVTICAGRSHTYESAVLHVCISVVYRMYQRRESYVSALRIVCVIILTHKTRLFLCRNYLGTSTLSINFCATFNAV